ncbi:MAG: MFS transporter [Bacteroidota bacterium]
MKRNGLIVPAFAALTLAFASFGDAFLYPFLPVNGLAVGIPLAWVGVLLSINRFVRILSNGLMVHTFSRYGLRDVMIAAALLAILSTAGYAFASGILLWLILRIVWGLSFSALRLGTLAYALQHPKQGTALGVSRGLQEAGPMLALFAVPVFIQALPPTYIFIGLSLLSLPALYFSLSLPNRKVNVETSRYNLSLRWPSTLNAITLLSAILVDGIFVVALGILFLHGRNISLIAATSLAAFYLGYRRICLVILSPVGGWIADKIGFETVFTATLALVIAGLILVASGWIAPGAIVIFTFYGIQSAITPGNVSKAQSSLVAVAENATWRDIGAAVGTLAGGFLIGSAYLSPALSIGTFVLIILALVHFKTRWKEFSFAWK